MITLQDVKNNKEIEAFIKSGQKQLDALGYTKHSTRHINIVSKRAGDLLEVLGYPKERIELARIAGYMHDIGNCINRIDHAHSGAILAYEVLKNMDMPAEHRSITKENTWNAVFCKSFGKAFPPKIRPSVSANASEFVMLRENAASV